MVNKALDLALDEEPFVLPNSPSGPLAVLAFKLEEGKYGQLTYVRVYSGTLQKGTVITNQTTGKKHKVPRLVRTHSDELQDTSEVKVGLLRFYLYMCAVRVVYWWIVVSVSTMHGCEIRFIRLVTCLAN